MKKVKLSEKNIHIAKDDKKVPKGYRIRITGSIMLRVLIVLVIVVLLGANHDFVNYTNYWCYDHSKVPNQTLAEDLKHWIHRDYTRENVLDIESYQYENIKPMMYGVINPIQYHKYKSIQDFLDIARYE